MSTNTKAPANYESELQDHELEIVCGGFAVLSLTPTDPVRLAPTDPIRLIPGDPIRIF